jgi:hypothetical protein
MAGNQHFSRLATGVLDFLAVNRFNVIKLKNDWDALHGFGSKQSDHANTHTKTVLHKFILIPLVKSIAE